MYPYFSSFQQDPCHVILGLQGDCLTITNPTEKHTNLQQTLFYISINICIDVTEIYGPIILSVESSVHEMSEQRRRTIEFCSWTFTVIPRNLPEPCKNCGVAQKQRKEIPCWFALFYLHMRTFYGKIVKNVPLVWSSTDKDAHLPVRT